MDFHRIVFDSNFHRIVLTPLMKWLAMTPREEEKRNLMKPLN